MPKTFKELIEALSPDDQKIVQGELDRRVTTGVKNYSATHPAADVLLQQLTARLDRVEKGKAERDSQFELQAHAIEKSYELGLPFSVVSDLLPLFKDQAALDSKLNDLAILGTKNKLQEVNEMLANNSYKPKSGNQEREASPMDKFRSRLNGADLSAFEAQVRRTNQN
ncbi:MAG: hypothetical protein A2001_13910 [Treponema sp. GWC1_61_84]|nr:MAG: hypothetical protein A2001_13910 [Treponema sp. GWC1_61_84]